MIGDIDEAKVAQEASVSGEDTCTHHWHDDRKPTRESREGWAQARCCECGTSAWVRVAKSSCGRRKYCGVAWGPSAEVEIRDRPISREI